MGWLFHIRLHAGPLPQLLRSGEAYRPSGVSVLCHKKTQNKRNDNETQSQGVKPCFARQTALNLQCCAWHSGL